MARTSKYLNTIQALQSTAAWRAGLYLRLSKEDGDREEGDKFDSDSILNQKIIMEDFLLENPEINLEDIYSDDGYTGTNFDRPDFLRMIEDVRIGKINCIIVKDLSRFARNYVEAAQYLEYYFKIMNIRFISIIDDIDSFLYPDSTNNISTTMKNVLNEEYIRDISIKVKSVLNAKRESGEYVGAFCPYGYLKSPDNKNKLIIDPVASENVKMIFKLYCQGKNPYRISVILNELGILNPSTYKKSIGLNYKSPKFIYNDGLWSWTTVKDILKNRIYTGDLVQGKTARISHKIHKIKKVPESEWIIKENTHEAIIDKTTFDNIQEILKRDTRTSQNKTELSLFAGFLKCADCGRPLIRKLSSKKNRDSYNYYVCRTYAFFKKDTCTRHTIRDDLLEKALYTVISKFIDIAVDMDGIIKEINNSLAKKNIMSRVETLIESKIKDKTRIENMILALYPDWKDNLLTRQQYVALKSKYEEELFKTDEVLSRLKKEKEKNGLDNINEFILNFIKFKNIERLSREVLMALVNQVFVHEGGAITVDFKFKDSYANAIEYIEANKELLTSKIKAVIDQASNTREHMQIQGGL